MAKNKVAKADTAKDEIAKAKEKIAKTPKENPLGGWSTGLFTMLLNAQKATKATKDHHLAQKAKETIAKKDIIAIGQKAKAKTLMWKKHFKI